MNTFQADTDDLKKLVKFYKALPKLYQSSVANFLSSVAYNARVEMIKELKKTNTIRVESLLNRLIMYEKSDYKHPVDNQQSRAGSVFNKVKRHDSFLTIASGRVTQATKFTMEGRGGSDKKRSLPSARNITGKQTTESDYNLSKGGPNRMAAYFQAISRDSKRRYKPFILTKRYKKMTPGIYKFKKGNVGTFRRKKYGNISRTLIDTPIVKLSEPKASMHPSVNKWHLMAVKRTVRESNLKRWWIESNVRQVERLGKRLKL